MYPYRPCYAEGDVLTCSPSADPEPDYEWYFPPTGNPEDLVANSSELVLTREMTGNGTQIMCVATNYLGTANKTFTLTIDDEEACPGNFQQIYSGHSTS